MTVFGCSFQPGPHAGPSNRLIPGSGLGDLRVNLALGNGLVDHSEPACRVQAPAGTRASYKPPRLGELGPPGKWKATRRTRTVNLRITNALLCQLSYGGGIGKASSGIRTPDLRFTKALLCH